MARKKASKQRRNHERREINGGENRSQTGTNHDLVLGIQVNSRIRRQSKPPLDSRLQESQRSWTAMSRTLIIRLGFGNTRYRKVSPTCQPVSDRYCPIEDDYTVVNNMLSVTLIKYSNRLTNLSTFGTQFGSTAIFSKTLTPYTDLSTSSDFIDLNAASDAQRLRPF